MTLENTLHNKFPREDYKELIELSLTYLNKTPKNFTIKKPGAIHRARWMSKMIYSLKIVLLVNKIEKMPAGTIFALETTQKEDLFRFVNFFCSMLLTMVGCIC